MDHSQEPVRLDRIITVIGCEISVRLEFVPRAAHAGFAVEKVLEQFFLHVPRFFLISIILILFHIHSRIIWRMVEGTLKGPVPQRLT
jgi:hypothetical protein